MQQQQKPRGGCSTPAAQRAPQANNHPTCGQPLSSTHSRKKLQQPHCSSGCTDQPIGNHTEPSNLASTSKQAHAVAATTHHHHTKCRHDGAPRKHHGLGFWATAPCTICDQALLSGAQRIPPNPRHRHPTIRASKDSSSANQCAAHVHSFQSRVVYTPPKSRAWGQLCVWQHGAPVNHYCHSKGPPVSLLSRSPPNCLLCSICNSVSSRLKTLTVTAELVKLLIIDRSTATMSRSGFLPDGTCCAHRCFTKGWGAAPMCLPGA